MNKKLFFYVDKKHAMQRIDKYLADKLASDYSRSDVKKFIKENLICVNAKLVKAHQKLKEGDQIEVIFKTLPVRQKITALDVPLEIIFEDEYLMVVNKPAGIVVHPSAGHFNDTLVNAVLFHTEKLSDLNGEFRLGVVHRLDKDTSGVLVLAKDNKTHRYLAEQFKERTVKKIYLAIVLGCVEYDEGQVDMPISRSPADWKKMAVLSCSQPPIAERSRGRGKRNEPRVLTRAIPPVSSRNAVTYYRVIKRTKDISVLEIQPKTGRTHQIRVHMAYLGHPLLGDRAYGKAAKGEFLNRHALHAKLLGFVHPYHKKFMEFEAPLPEDMKRVLSGLGL